MNSKFPVLVFAFTLSAPVFAQAPNPYDGTWKLTFDGPRTGGLEGAVVIKGETGTWKQDPGNSRNPCFKQEAPISIESTTGEELVFRVNRSKVLAGCEDPTMTFKKVDDKTLTRTAADGRVFTLTRQ